MALFREQPNQYNGSVIPCTTATDAAVDFGFGARRVQIQNERAAPVYTNFNSSTPTTGGYKTCAGDKDSVELPGGCSMVGIASTTTSTSTRVQVVGLGG